MSESVAWVLLCSGVWFAIGLLTGLVGHRVPLGRLEHDTWLTRLRPSELDGRFYERRLRIRHWKDRLPEAGETFAGGFSKRHLADRSESNLSRFVAETRRAEYVHWTNAAAGPLFLLFLPVWAGALMIVFGPVVHLPFVAIQRYNRARITRLLRRRPARAAPVRATPAPK